MTVEENLTFIGSIKGYVDEREIDDIMKKTDLMNERN